MRQRRQIAGEASRMHKRGGIYQFSISHLLMDIKVFSRRGYETNIVIGIRIVQGLIASVWCGSDRDALKIVHSFPDVKDPSLPQPEDLSTAPFEAVLARDGFFCAVFSATFAADCRMIRLRTWPLKHTAVWQESEAFRARQCRTNVKTDQTPRIESAPGGEAARLIPVPRRRRP